MSCRFASDCLPILTAGVSGIEYEVLHVQLARGQHSVTLLHFFPIPSHILHLIFLESPLLCRYSGQVVCWNLPTLPGATVFPDMLIFFSPGHKPLRIHSRRCKGHVILPWHWNHLQSGVRDRVHLKVLRQMYPPHRRVRYRRPQNGNLSLWSPFRSTCVYCPSHLILRCSLMVPGCHPTSPIKPTTGVQCVGCSWPLTTDHLKQHPKWCGLRVFPVNGWPQPRGSHPDSWADG